MACTLFFTYILRFPAATECSLLANIFNINEIDDFCFAQTHSFIAAAGSWLGPSSRAERQVRHIAETGDSGRWRHQCYPITDWNKQIENVYWESKVKFYRRKKEYVYCIYVDILLDSIQCHSASNFNRMSRLHRTRN